MVAATSTSALAIGSLLYWHDIGQAASWMPASARAIFERGELWRLWTTLFAHGDLGHLASNTLLFFILGFFLYGYFGARVFPVAAFACGALANYFVLTRYGPNVHLIGASGIVYWMGGCWLVMYYFLSRQKNTTHRILRTLGVALMLFAPSGALERPGDVEAALNTSHLTHFVGFVLGIAFGLAYYFAHRKRFLAAEEWETVVEEDDPNDELPPPEGFPIETGNRSH